MNRLSKILLSGAAARFLCASSYRAQAKLWRSTINLDRSLEHGILIPNVSIGDVGTCTHMGKRQHQEDRFSVKAFEDGTLYLAVFDGHGGSLAAEYAAHHMPQILESNLQDKSSNIANSLEKAFTDVNCQLLQFIRKRNDDTERYSGTTATVCLIKDNVHLYTASVGDSRAILCRKSQPLTLTEDQRPDRLSEKQRIEDEGGVIVSNSLGEPLVNGRLAMTRSIGDFDLKPYGVTEKPEYNYKKLNHSKDAFLALFTDGITFSLTNDEVVKMIVSSTSPKLAAEHVVEMSQQLGSQDNSTAVVLPLGAWGSADSHDTSISYEFGRTLTPRD